MSAPRTATFHYSPPFRHGITVVDMAAAFLSRAQTKERHTHLARVPHGFVLTTSSPTYIEHHIFHIEPEAAIDAMIATTRLVDSWWDNGLMNRQELP